MRHRKNGVSIKEFNTFAREIIADSFIVEFLGNTSKDLEATIVDSDLQIFNKLVISRHNKLYLFWKFLDVLSCFISSCFYAYMAAFEDPHPESVMFVMMWVFESVFLISMVLNFLVEYRNEGEERPIRDIVKIGHRYLKGAFANDLVPLIPLQLI